MASAGLAVPAAAAVLGTLYGSRSSTPDPFITPMHAGRAQAALDKLVAELQTDHAVKLKGDGLRESLSDAEQCLLQNFTVLSPRLTTAQCNSIWDAVAKSAAAHDVAQTVRGAAWGADLPGTCWQAPSSGLLHVQPACTPTLENVAARQGLISEYGSLHGPSMLSDVLLARNLSITLSGHSEWGQLYHALRCELLRRDPRSLRLVQFVEHKPSLSTLRDAAKEMVAAGGGVIFASIGLHYNNAADSCPKRGRESSKDTDLQDGNGKATYVAAFDCGFDRGLFSTDLRNLLGVLDNFSRACKLCLGIYATASPSHFQTPDGAFALSVFQANTTGNGCAPFPPERLSSLPPSTAQRWRHEDAEKEWEAGNHSSHVPLMRYHLLDSHAWSAHPGNGGLKKLLYSELRVHHGRLIVRKPATDCLHYCYSPLLYKSMWRALEVIVLALSGP